MFRCLRYIKFIVLIALENEQPQAGRTFWISETNTNAGGSTHNFLYGTGRKEKAAYLDLTTAEMTIINPDCDTKYAKCRRHCENPRFCSLYCSPICCISHSTIVCKDSIRHLKYNTTQKSLSNRFWISGYNEDVGVWGKDQMYVQPLPKQGQQWEIIDLGVQRIVFKSLVAAFFDTGNLRYSGSIGLSRDPKIKNFVQLCFEGKHISQQIVTIVRPVIDGYIDHRIYFVFGEYANQHCEPNWEHVDVIGEREWIFDAIGVSFLEYHSKHNFRVLLKSDHVVDLPRHVLDDFLRTGFINVADCIGIQNIYEINESRTHEDFDVFFNINKRFKLDIGDALYHVGFPNTFQARGILPNPDNVQWGIGRIVFQENCVALDYDKNQIAFSKAKRNGQTRRYRHLQDPYDKCIY